MEQVVTSINAAAETLPNSPQARYGGAAAKQLAACLRLKQGASAQGTFVLEDVPGGTSISVGSDPACDWQIRAANVSERALEVMLIGGVMFAKCPPESCALLNGRALEAMWTEVPSGSRIDIGLARLELTLGEKSSAFENLPQAYVPGTFDGTGKETVLLVNERRQPHEQSGAGAWDASDDSYDVPFDAAPAQRERERPRPSFVERLSRPSLLGAPSLLDDGLESAPRRTMWRYGLVAMATAVAYAGWVVLLDRL